MINFFREIRKKLADDNKPLKYMRYALGEMHRKNAALNGTLEKLNHFIFSFGYQTNR